MKTQRHFLTRFAVLFSAVSMLTAWVACNGRAESPKGNEGSWKFAVFGDHRGDNKAFKVVTNADGTKVTVGYTDGGINKPALASLAAALKAEEVAFALDVGDLVTKWQPAINGKDADTLLTEQLADWRTIWLGNAGDLPLFPVRGNQEWSGPLSTWLRWLQTMPGIGDIRKISVPAHDTGFSYAFAYRNCLFVAVDEYASAISSDSPTITPDTLAWMADLFRPGGRPHVFVYGHAPAYEVWDSKKAAFTVMKDGLPSPAPVDAAGNPLTPVLSHDALQTVRDPFWNLLGVRAASYFCGHDHIYARGVASDETGNLVRQVIIGNGGAPPPAQFSPAYGNDPFVESISGLEPGSSRYVNNWGSSRIFCEAFEQPGHYGYLVVVIHGSHATATYKAQPPEGGPFVAVESWSWKIAGHDVKETSQTE